MRKRISTPLVLLAVALSAACQDLVVEDTNDPDRTRALSQPGDVETLIASTFQDMWGRLHTSGSSTNTMPLVADEMSGTYANNAALELSSEPRPAFNNTPLADAEQVGFFQWQSWYKAASSANDGLGSINDGLKITIGEDDFTERDRTFAKFMQGIGHGYIALLFDRGFYITAETDVSDPKALPLLDYPVLMDSAMKSLQQAIDFAKQAPPFTLPPEGINGTEFNNDDIQRLAYSFMARFMVYLPRTPEERAAVDWNKVIELVDKGITQDFRVTLQSGVLTSSLYSRMQRSDSFSAWGDYKLIGPSDVSGNYQAWLGTPIPDRERFKITTPDRRITGPGPEDNGAYFRYRADNIFRPERGTYHQSYYQWYRNGGHSISGTAYLMLMDEMNLFKAEAYYFLGDKQKAADLINISRTRSHDIGGTTYDGLPPVTANGVPQADDCVPRTETGACGSLHDALVYERMIELALTDALRAYLDSRGFGRLPEGTFLQFPIPGSELQVLNQPIYSFGGVGGPSAAN